MKSCINVLGLGKLGYPMACFLSKNKNFNIKAWDINEDLIRKLNDKKFNYLPYEKNLKKYKNKRNIKIEINIADSLKNTVISFITVPTPSTSRNNFSNKYLIQAISNIAKYIKSNNIKNYIININSTVSPGSFDNEIIPFLSKKFNLKLNDDYHLVYNPHFVALGDVVSALENPDFILIGFSSTYAEKFIKNIYKKLYKRKNLFKSMTLKEAELTKLLVNCYVTTKISFTNFVNDIALKNRKISADVVLDAVGTDKRIGNNYFKSGGPFSGPCFPRDNLALKYFCKTKKISSLIPAATDKINIQTINKLKRKIVSFKKQNKTSIGFLGIGYKPNTACSEDSVALKLIDEAKKNKMKIFYYDKYTEDKLSGCNKLSSISGVFNKSSIIFVSYKDKEFKLLERLSNKKKIVWDIYNFIKSGKYLLNN